MSQSHSSDSSAYIKQRCWRSNERIDKDLVRSSPNDWDAQWYPLGWVSSHIFAQNKPVLVETDSFLAYFWGGKMENNVRDEPHDL